MKTAHFLMLGLLIATHIANAAQTVEKEISANGNWKAAKILGHDFSQKNACISTTRALEDGTTLEVYAEKQADSNTDYVEPTVLVVTRAEPSFVRAVLTDEDATTKYQLTLASTTATPPVFAAMARIDDRAKLIALLKASNTARLQLINEKNKVVKVLNFSLKGSSKTIDSQLASCSLPVPN